MSILIATVMAISLNSYGSIPVPTVKKPMHEKLGSAMSSLVAIYLSEGEEVAQRFADTHAIELNDSRVLVELTLNRDVLVADIGRSIFSRYDVEVAVQSEHFIEVMLPIEHLVDFAESMTNVSRIHRPYRPFSSVTSQGVGLIGADDFHDEGYGGAGVKIAVLDGGFREYDSAIENGELPENVTIRNFANEPMDEGSPHGSACAEIVYDLVPDADIYLIKSSGSATYENAMSYLIREQVDIISYSMGYANAFNDYFEGGDPICARISEAADEGILFVTSAGNQAKMHYRSQFDDDNENDNYHRFADGVWVNHFGNSPNSYANVRRNERIWVTLQWDDFPESGEDLNLYILHWENNEWDIVESSENVQNGNDRPTEDIMFVVQESGRYGFAVHNRNAENGIDFTLFASHDLGYRTLENSLTIPAIGEDALAVGAVYRGQWNRQNPQLEGFSSRGPTNDNRTKPDIAGPDGTASFTYDGEFYGTSSSCPHVAGAAGLVLSVDNGMDNQDLWDYLTDHARDVGDNGQDNLFGHGLLHLEVDIEPVPHIVVEPDEIIAERAAGYEIVISNEGGVDLEWQSIVFYEDGDNWITLDPDEGTVDAHDSQEVRAVLDDNDLDGGEYRATIHILSNDPNEADVPISVTFNTEGHAPEIVVWPEELDFGEVNQGDDNSDEILIINIGNSDLILSDVAIQGDYFISDFDGEIRVEPNAETTISVTFLPEAGGEFEGLLTIFSNDPAFDEFEVSLTGVGINLPPIVVNPIEDVEIFEDSEMTLIADLDEVFEDPEGGELSYSIFDMGGIVGDIDLNENLLWLTPEPDWNGEAGQLLISAEDDHEQFVSYEFGIIVRPVNDAPEEFDLIAPAFENEYGVDNYTVTFEWEEAEDVDNDEVLYYLHLNVTDVDAVFGIDTTVIHSQIRETEYLEHIDSLLIELGLMNVEDGIIYQIDWWVEASDREEVTESSHRWRIFTVTHNDVSMSHNGLPATFNLNSPYPNPFNSTTDISYSLPTGSHLSLRVYDLNGQIVATLIDQQQTAGNHQVKWDAQNLSSGVYLVYLEASSYRSVKKVVLVR